MTIGRAAGKLARVLALAAAAQAAAVPAQAWDGSMGPDIFDENNRIRPLEYTMGLPGSRGHNVPGGVPVGACVVDGWDTSSSVNDTRFELQREALARSLESSEFSYALRHVEHNRIALHIAYFSDNAAPAVNGQGWVVVDEQSRFDVARAVRNAPRRFRDSTNTHIFMRYALERLEDCSADINVVDIMTDGKIVEGYESTIAATEAARDAATRRGVTVNVLAMLVPRERDVGIWAERHLVTPMAEDQVTSGVIGPAGPVRPGIVLTLDPQSGNDFSEWVTEFNELKKRKLVIEMTRTEDHRRLADAFGWADMRVAMARVSMAQPVQVAAGPALGIQYSR